MAHQVGGDHYQVPPGQMQHWDICVHFKVPYTIGCATKYLFRWKGKNGLQDLDKAIHYLQKSLENIDVVGGTSRFIPKDVIPETVEWEERDISLIAFNFEFPRHLNINGVNSPHAALKLALTRAIEFRGRVERDKIALLEAGTRNAREKAMADGHPVFGEDQPKASELHPE